MLRDYLPEALNGPLAFRFFLQPLLALLLGIRDGRKDRKVGREPYFISIVTGEGRRWARIERGLKEIAVPLAVAVVLDLVVQFLLLDRPYLWGALVVGTLLIALPYVLARGLTNRAMRAVERHRERSEPPAHPPSGD